MSTSRYAAFLERHARLLLALPFLCVAAGLLVWGLYMLASDVRHGGEALILAGVGAGSVLFLAWARVHRKSRLWQAFGVSFHLLLVLPGAVGGAMGGYQLFVRSTLTPTDLLYGGMSVTFGAVCLLSFLAHMHQSDHPPEELAEPVVRRIYARGTAAPHDLRLTVWRPGLLMIVGVAPFGLLAGGYLAVFAWTEVLPSSGAVPGLGLMGVGLLLAIGGLQAALGKRETEVSTARGVVESRASAGVNYARSTLPLGDVHGLRVEPHDFGYGVHHRVEVVGPTTLDARGRPRERTVVVVERLRDGLRAGAIADELATALGLERDIAREVAPLTPGLLEALLGDATGRDLPPHVAHEPEQPEPEGPSER